MSDYLSEAASRDGCWGGKGGNFRDNGIQTIAKAQLNYGPLTSLESISKENIAQRKYYHFKLELGFSLKSQ